MPANEQNRAAKQCAFGAQEPVADPPADERAQIEQATVCADKRGGLCLVHAEPAGGGIEVVGENGLHAVEAKALPHFNSGDCW